jgi:hypothetical protein
MPSLVAQVPAADSACARAHFEESFRFETDCADVHQGLMHSPDFLRLDVRGPEAFAAGHVPGAINIPHARIIASRMVNFWTLPATSTTPQRRFQPFGGPHWNRELRPDAVIRCRRQDRRPMPLKKSPHVVGSRPSWFEKRRSQIGSSLSKLLAD